MRARIGATATLTAADLDRALAAAAEVYRHLPPALAQLHPVVLTRALELAGGNPRRIVAEADGSATVTNRPTW